MFHDSLERCRARQDFLDIFYDRLQQLSEEISFLFHNADIQRIKKMIQQSLLLIMMASEGSHYSRKRLNILANQHKSAGIRPEHYTVWLNTLLSVVEEYDPQYNLTIDASWREVLGRGIELMKGV